MKMRRAARVEQPPLGSTGGVRPGGDGVGVRIRGDNGRRQNDPPDDHHPLGAVVFRYGEPLLQILSDPPRRRHGRSTSLSDQHGQSL